MPNFEAAESWRVGEWSFGLFPDMGAQFALQDSFQKGADFIFFAGGQKLDPAVAQIPDGAGDIESFGYLPDGIAKTNALDAALVKDLNGYASRQRKIHPASRRQLPARFMRFGRRRRQIGIGQFLGRRDQPRVV